MKRSETPYKTHLFICGKSRGGDRKSCGDTGSPNLKDTLKDAVKDQGWKGIVRVSESSCLGICEIGPNIMIYPQQILLSDVSIDDIPEILDTLEEIIGG